MRDFIGIKLGDVWLDLPEDLSIQLEIWNALFETDRIPGSMMFPITLPHSPVNSRELGFPGHLAVARYRQPQLPCQLFLMGQLWRLGKLNLIKRTDKGYEVNFQTDVGDISTEMKELSLRELDLGTGSLSLGVSGIYPASAYAIFPVHNPDFHDGKNEFYNGVVNHYNGGFLVDQQRTLTPFPFLLSVLEKAMATFGYTVIGPWLQEEETRRLAIYNTYALDTLALGEGSEIRFTNHVPDMKVNEFLKAVRSLFCLGMVFNPVRKELEIVRLDAVAKDRTYVEWTGNTSRVYDWEPATGKGFKLEMVPDSEDVLQKTAPNLLFAVGAGQEPVSCQVSTLGMGIVGSKLLPQASQKGGNLEGTGEQASFSLRLLSYRGLQPDTAGVDYPLGTSGTTNAAGAQIGTDSLEWEGPAGLYERRHKGWLSFLADAETIQTEQTFRIQDILDLDCRRRSFIRHGSGTFTGFWEKVSLTVSRKKGLQAAKVPIKRIY